MYVGDHHEVLLGLGQFLQFKGDVKFSDWGKFAISKDGYTYRTYQIGDTAWYMDKSNNIVLRTTIPKFDHDKRSVRGLRSSCTKYMAKLEKHLESFKEVVSFKLIPILDTDTHILRIRLEVTTPLTEDGGVRADAIYAFKRLREELHAWTDVNNVPW